MTRTCVSAMTGASTVTKSRAGGPSDGEQAAVVTSSNRIEARSTVKLEAVFIAAGRSLEGSVSAEARRAPGCDPRLLTSGMFRDARIPGGRLHFGDLRNSPVVCGCHVF